MVPLENRALGENELPLLLEALHRTSLKYPHLFLTVLKELRLDVKIANREQIGSLFPQEEWTFLQKLADADKGELDAMLQHIFAELEANQYDHLLYSRAKQIAHRQVCQGSEDSTELCRLIEAVPENQWLDFNEIIAVYKLGLLKDPDAISVLAPLFSRPEDFLQEELADVLITLQSDEVVRSVEVYARSEDPVFQINTIARTHSKLAVATLKQLYADLDHMDSQAFIIEGLAEQLAPEGRPQIEHYMSQKRLPSIFNNEEMAYGYFKVLEFDHPELERWGQNARAEHEGMLKARDEPFDVTLQRYLKSKNEKTQAVSDKVGRNDPCPCGSGKKYKKCHGK